MESTRQHFENQQGPTSGVARDIERLKTSGAETADELREFMASLKGRTPHEVMGAVAQSSLFRSIFLATLASAAVLLLLTAIPYSWNKYVGKETVASESAPRAAEAANTEPAAAQPENPSDAPAVVETPNSGEPNAAAAAKALGIGEAADPDAAPKELDTKLDKLLDGL